MENMKLNINPADLPEVTCGCGNKIWLSAVILKKISALVSPTGKDEMMPIPYMLCAKCGKSLQESMKEEEETKPKLHLV